MKVCEKCEKNFENIAVFCMFCGSKLIEIEDKKAKYEIKFPHCSVNDGLLLGFSRKEYKELLDEYEDEEEMDDLLRCGEYPDENELIHITSPNLDVRSLGENDYEIWKNGEKIGEGNFYEGKEAFENVELNYSNEKQFWSVEESKGWNFSYEFELPETEEFDKEKLCLKSTVYSIKGQENRLDNGILAKDFELFYEDINAKLIFGDWEPVYSDFSWFKKAPQKEISQKKETNHSSLGSLSGASFCFTGKLEKWTRKEAEEMVRKNGGIVKSSVTAGLTYLVTNTPDSDSIKNRTAESLGVEKITENDFITLMTNL